MNLSLELSVIIELIIARLSDRINFINFKLQLNEGFEYILTSSSSSRILFFKSLEDKISVFDRNVDLELEKIIKLCFRRITHDQHLICLSAMSICEEPILFPIFKEIFETI